MIMSKTKTKSKITGIKLNEEVGFTVKVAAFYCLLSAILFLGLFLTINHLADGSIFYYDQNQKPISLFRVMEENWRYFTYKGEPVVLQTYANPFGVKTVDGWVGDENPETIDCMLDLMKEHQMNHFYHLVDLRLDEPNCPMAEPLNSDENIIWDEEEYWPNLRKLVNYANSLDITLEIVLSSEALLERGDGRWPDHAWNELNGGPIPQDQLFGFFKLTDPDETLGWPIENRKYQEQLIEKYLDEFDSKINVVWNLMWEIDDADTENIPDAIDWMTHASDYIIEHQRRGHMISITPTRCSDKDRIKICRHQNIDFLMIENRGARDEFLVFNKPVVVGGPWAEREIEEPEFMNLCVIKGLHPSTNLYSHTIPEETPGFDYALELGEFFKTVETWDDEPGVEITEENLPPVN